MGEELDHNLEFWKSQLEKAWIRFPNLFAAIGPFTEHSSAIYTGCCTTSPSVLSGG